jgi:VanZ family protein
MPESRPALTVSPLRLHAASRILFWGLVLLVSSLMLMPHPPRSINLGWDKLNHVAAFAATAWAGCLMLATGRGAGLAPPMPWAGAWSMLVAGLLTWGAAIEVLQRWMPPRTGDVADWLADAVGVALGCALWAAIRLAWIRARAR